MILWDVVSSRALLRLRQKLPFEKWMESPLHNEQAAQWFQAKAPAVACHQVARHAPNHPATVRPSLARTNLYCWASCASCASACTG